VYQIGDGSEQIKAVYYMADMLDNAG